MNRFNDVQPGDWIHIPGDPDNKFWHVLEVRDIPPWNLLVESGMHRKTIPRGVTVVAGRRHGEVFRLPGVYIEV